MKKSLRTLTALWVAISMPAEAQSPPLIARLSPTSATGHASCLSAFKEGMREIGMVEGKQCVIDQRYAEGDYRRFPALTEDVLKRNPALIMVFTIAAAQAAQQATKTVPILFVGVNDPLGSGLVGNLAHPEGNTTGLSNQAEDIMTKNLQLLREVLPRATRVAVLFNPLNASNPKLVDAIMRAAPDLGISAQAFGIGSPAVLDATMAGIAKYKPDALLAVRDGMISSQGDRLATFALKLRVPFFVGQSGMIGSGGLMVYDTSLNEQCRRSATYAKKLLEGVKPADLPIEQPTKFQLVINLKTAKALGLTIPQSVLLRADEVIQ